MKKAYWATYFGSFCNNIGKFSHLFHSRLSFYIIQDGELGELQRLDFASSSDKPNLARLYCVMYGAMYCVLNLIFSFRQQSNFPVKRNLQEIRPKVVHG